MKVILNVDVKYLGEEGDVKNVATGYARNYLLPRALAVPFTPETEALFEAKKAEIEARKEVKRANARTLKEKLEGSSFAIEMPAGANGRLYGAVSTHVVADILSKNGFDIERKRIDIPGLAIKTVGTYHAVVKLYEAQTAEITLVVKAQGSDEEKAETKKEAKKEEPEQQNEAKEESLAEGSAE